MLLEEKLYILARSLAARWEHWITGGAEIIDLMYSVRLRALWTTGVMDSTLLKLIRG